jgi:hypothetical protein
LVPILSKTLIPEGVRFAQKRETELIKITENKKENKERLFLFIL